MCIFRRRKTDINVKEDRISELIDKHNEIKKKIKQLEKEKEIIETELYKEILEYVVLKLRQEEKKG